VHRGTLRTGEDVAIKVQYPGIVESLHSDLKNLAALMGFKRAVVDKKRLDEWMEECRRAILEEADYELEAYHLRRFAEHVEGRAGVRVPTPFEEWTRPSVLVMEYVDGQKFDEALAQITDEARRKSLLERFVLTYVWMFHELYELHSDPHPGNFLLDSQDNLVVLDFGCVKRCPEPLADGVLEILIACWDDDDNRAAALYRELGFGRDGADERTFDPTLLREYHEIILAPFLYDGDFDFGGWKPTPRLMRFVMKNPRFLKITPPADLLLYLRVLSGVKGLLTKLDAKLNLRRMARNTLVRMGRLPAVEAAS
jgi:predicted unusual protein kinase regulating ubiquinone biosynthesis (AarF/ABC1/UbiB family)